MSAMEVAAESLFGLDNLPYGVFDAPGATGARIGVRVGDYVVELAGLLDGVEFGAPTLNPFLARGPGFWADARARVRARLEADDVPAGAVHPLATVTMRLPFAVADYIDFYACDHHAANLGRLFRPNSPPLLPNWKHLPVGYHGRAGTVVVSGTDIARPRGQRRNPDGGPPLFGPSTRLDIETELGFVVGVPSQLGTPIAIDDFAAHVFGVVLVNDWSARDLQEWEYVPLGPFLGKSFATSISPWVVPLAALDAAKVPGRVQEPAPLPYLRAREHTGLDIDFTVRCNGHPVSTPPYTAMYWTPAQLLAHATINGAAARTGDLFAAGTVSGPRRDQSGSFIELTWNGAHPVTVGDQRRTFLIDGDEIVISATAPGPHGRIGLGEVRGTVRPAQP